MCAELSLLGVTKSLTCMSEINKVAVTLTNSPACVFDLEIGISSNFCWSAWNLRNYSVDSGNASATSGRASSTWSHQGNARTLSINYSSSQLFPCASCLGGSTVVSRRRTSEREDPSPQFLVVVAGRDRKWQNLWHACQRSTKSRCPLTHTLATWVCLTSRSKVSENSTAGFQISIRRIAFLTTLTAFSAGFEPSIDGQHLQAFDWWSASSSLRLMVFLKGFFPSKPRTRDEHKKAQTTVLL